MRNPNIITLPEPQTRRQEAEFFYVLAILYARNGKKYIVAGYAKECLELLKKLGTETMRDCATSLTCVEGVCLPEFLHEGTLANGLKPYGIKVKEKRWLIV